MNILTEIIELSDELIDSLTEQKFFEETPFVSPLDLKREIQKQMQYNWEQTNDIRIDEDQFLQICRDLTKSRISIGLGDLVDSGHVQTAVNPDGELVYSLTGKPLEL